MKACDSGLCTTDQRAVVQVRPNPAQSEIGERATLTCIVVGAYPPANSITWNSPTGATSEHAVRALYVREPPRRGGDSAAGNEVFEKATHLATVVFQVRSEKDFGEYTCVYENNPELGYSEGQAFVFNKTMTEVRKRALKMKQTQSPATTTITTKQPTTQTSPQTSTTTTATTHLTTTNKRITTHANRHINRPSKKSEPQIATTPAGPFLSFYGVHLIAHEFPENGNFWVDCCLQSMK